MTHYGPAGGTACISLVPFGELDDLELLIGATGGAAPPELERVAVLPGEALLSRQRMTLWLTKLEISHMARPVAAC
jgi:hypothetical protein